MRLSARTKLYGLIGGPVSHSLSPAIMNRAFSMRAMDAVYLAFSLESPGLADAVRGMAALGACGINVTYPFKEEVLSFADEACAGALATGAANTIAFRRRKTLAFNTDAAGARTALEKFGGLSIAGKRVLILGAGGAGRAAAYGLLEGGASEVRFCVRRLSKRTRLAMRLAAHYPGRRVSVLLFSDRDEEVRRAFEGSDIVMNATPVGMQGYAETSLPFEATWLNPDITCFDFVYHPPETEFLKVAREACARTLGGLELLVAQASEALRIWTGEGFSIQEMLDYVRNVIEREDERDRARSGKLGEAGR